MNAGNNEVAYNTAVNCWVPNETLNGAEGGCLEIIGNKAGQLIENAYSHHNYCERSVGLFEACAGNFTRDGQKIQLNHAVVRHSTGSGFGGHLSPRPHQPSREPGHPGCHVSLA